MTKASVRAIDAIQEFVAHQYPSEEWTLDYFTVLGASKRGWTTWLVGAVDPRVSALVPVVMDAIHMHAFFHHQYQAYGGWSFTMEDYVAMDIMSWIDSPEMELWATMDDPFTFFDRLTMPKLIVNGVYDEVTHTQIHRHTHPCPSHV
jgi:PhoPQ-activated pathogenicity-related protein